MEAKQYENKTEDEDENENENENDNEKEEEEEKERNGRKARPLREPRAKRHEPWRWEGTLTA